MKLFSIGGSGALRVDEKLHIQSLKRPYAKEETLLSDTLFAIRDDKGKVRVLHEDFDDVKCRPTFLGATYKFADKSFSAKISAAAVTPFSFGKDAHIPAAAFSFKIKNKSKKSRSYTFAVLVENFLKDTFHQSIQTEKLCGVQLSSATALSVKPEYMTHTLLVDGAADVVRYVNRDNTRKTFLTELKKGALTEMDYTMPADSDCAAVRLSFVLNAGESKTLRMVYAWHAPNVQLAQAQNGDLLLKDSDMTDFQSSMQIAEYVLENWAHLVDFSKTVVEALKDSADSKTFEYAACENFSAVHAGMARKALEPGNVKIFYKNSFGAPFIYTKKGTEALFPASVYFDFAGEANALSWALEYCMSERGLYAGLPSESCGEIEQKDAEYLDLHLSPIWRVYRLYKLSGDVACIERLWDKLERILTYTTTCGWVKEDEAVVTGQHAVLGGRRFLHENAYSTCFYILSLLCMQQMALALERQAQAAQYAKLAADGKAFVKRNLFNGRFYIERIDEESRENQNCWILQILPMLIGESLGLNVADEGQFDVALENIYVLNYQADEENGIHGVKNFSDAEGFDAGAELLYACALLRRNKAYLASLVCKAQYARGGDVQRSTDECLFVNALFSNAYDAVKKQLYIGKNDVVYFVKDAVVFVRAGKETQIRVLGTSVQIDAVTYTGKGKPTRITYGGMELMYVKEGEIIRFSAPLVLSEGEELTIYTAK